MSLPIDLKTLRVRDREYLPRISVKINKAQSVAADGPLPIEFRKSQLRNLFYAILDNSHLLEQALEVDLHRPATQTKLLELGGVLDEIKTAIDQVDKWAAAKRTDFDIKCIAAAPKLVPEPYGLVLVIGPWNYPYLCSVAPIVSAIAAGNCVVFKPSEMVPHACEILVRVLETALDPHIFTAITGGVEETTEVLTHKFDKICFTGSPNVGKVVSSAAAKHLTPCLLELGGKCPVVVDASADLELAARRIVWGKFVNAGQTCVAPDYVLVESHVKDKLVALINEQISDQYPGLTKTSTDFAHIVSERLWTRANNLVNASKGKVHQYGGTPDKETLYFPPTVVENISIDDSLMKEELFGPILPVISVRNPAQAVPLIKNHDTPLALYIFSNNKQAIAELQVVRSGAVLVNDVLMHGASATIPFGGIGNSGNGSYHGKFGFEAFSHYRPVMTQPGYLESMLNFRYPPYTTSKQNLISKVTVPLGVWFPREGQVKPSILRRLLSKSWLVVLIVGALWYYRR